MSWSLRQTRRGSLVIDRVFTKYPSLLRNMPIDRPNQVWCADITFVPVRNGFLYLIAIMDNIFIERLWRSLKQEAIYLEEMSDGF